MSKYEKKRVEREEGTRPEFDFVDAAPPPSPQPAPARRPRSATTGAKRPVQRVKAVVKDIVPGKECAFLVSADGQGIYMSLRIFRRDCGTIRIAPRWEIDCETEDDLQPGRYPRVKRIFSAAPQQK